MTYYPDILLYITFHEAHHHQQYSIHQLDEYVLYARYILAHLVQELVHHHLLHHHNIHQLLHISDANIHISYIHHQAIHQCIQHVPSHTHQSQYTLLHHLFQQS